MRSRQNDSDYTFRDVPIESYTVWLEKVPVIFQRLMDRFRFELFEVTMLLHIDD